MQTDTEAQNLLAPALSMSDAEAANHYVQVAHEWYNQQNSIAFKAFSHNQHIHRISKLLQSKEEKAPLDAVRALAFVASAPRLHTVMFDCGILDAMVRILGSSTHAATCEAALVVMNHLVQQNRETNRKKYNRISEFCKQHDALVVVFRYAHVQDSCRSLLANVFSVLAQLCNGRPDVQERCIRAGIMERAYNLKTSYRERTVRMNAEIFLKSMQLEGYAVDKFNDMHTTICVEMGYPSRALCLAVWKLMITDRKRDAERVNRLLRVVMQITEEDKTLNNAWDTLENSIMDYDKTQHQQHEVHQPQPQPSPSIHAHPPPQPQPPYDMNNGNGMNGMNGANGAQTSPTSINGVNGVHQMNGIQSVHPNHGVNAMNGMNGINGMNHSNHSNHHSSPSQSPHPSHPSLHSNGGHSAHSNGYHHAHHYHGNHGNHGNHHGAHGPLSHAPIPIGASHSNPHHNAHNGHPPHPVPNWNANALSARSQSSQCPHNSHPHSPLNHSPLKPSLIATHSDSHEIHDEKEAIGVHQMDSEHYVLDNVNPQQMQRHKTWLEKDLHIAILQTNPILVGDGGSLALNAERKRLEDIFCRTSRGLKFFFGVLTKDSLIRCIQRGAQILHISGHGPHAKKLEVEDKFGRAEHLSAAKIKEAIEKGSASKKHGGLKLVFVSTCHSEWVAQSFCDAGVPHAVAVHSEVLILDKMATKFASAFYEALVIQNNSVEDAFTNSKAELLLEATEDCCCSHMGHKPECLCVLCKKQRCCKKHHGPQSQCANKIDIECCQPDVPHKHSDKFLLLPKGRNHKSKILCNLPNVPSERIDCRPPTNIAAAKQRILDRAKVLSNLVYWLHPETPQQKAMDAVWIFGRSKVGLTALSLEVGRFFTRAWYQPLFPGGVFRVNLAKCYDPKALFLYIAQEMRLEMVNGTYSYWDNTRRRFIRYDKATQSELLKAMSGDTITPPIETVNEENGETNYILLRQHVNHEEMVRHAVPPQIYERFLMQKQRNSLPMEFGFHPEDGTKVISKKIKFNEPDETEILSSIRSYGLHRDAAESEKLFIFDHINFPIHTGKVKQFLQKIKRLNESVKCKLLLVCSNLIEPEISKLQHQHGYIAKSKFQRINPIKRTEAVKLLMNSARKFYNLDFHGLERPATEEQMAQFPLFEWLSKSPALIQHTATVLDRRVPLCVIIQQLDADPSQWGNALTQGVDWQKETGWTPDEQRDAELALINLLNHIAQVKDIWADQQPSEQRARHRLRQLQPQPQPHPQHGHVHGQDLNQRQKPHQPHRGSDVGDGSAANPNGNADHQVAQ